MLVLRIISYAAFALLLLCSRLIRAIRIRNMAFAEIQDNSVYVTEVLEESIAAVDTAAEEVISAKKAQRESSKTKSTSPSR